jgi:hypothetical protein
MFGSGPIFECTEVLSDLQDYRKTYTLGWNPVQVETLCATRVADLMGSEDYDYGCRVWRSELKVVDCSRYHTSNDRGIFCIQLSGRRTCLSNPADGFAGSQVRGRADRDIGRPDDRPSETRK